MRTKVIQVYREALQETKGLQDADMRSSMTQYIKDLFQPLRRDRRQTDWKLDVPSIDYHLALIRKQINFVKELKDRVSWSI